MKYDTVELACMKWNLICYGKVPALMISICHQHGIDTILILYRYDIGTLSMQYRYVIYFIDMISIRYQYDIVTLTRGYESQ